MKYDVTVSKRAIKSVSRLQEDVRLAIASAIRNLTENPFPLDARKIFGKENCWRIKVRRNYRIVYEVHQQQLLINVLLAGNRKDKNL